ncbi:hypothetical protein T492DRAFT_196525 [Pavlovales sp. CCMP2436]|nr:hypothetical protein T492DRAFT_196525 [Pavlovales sp. CCMP2436]
MEIKEAKTDVPAISDARAAFVLFDSLTAAAGAAAGVFRVSGMEGPGPSDAWNVHAAAEPREVLLLLLLLLFNYDLLIHRWGSRRWVQDIQVRSLSLLA